MVLFRSRVLEDWRGVQRRMLRETEVYLDHQLKHPDHRIRIPSIRVGFGTFPRGYAQAFWAQVLETS